MVIRFYFWIYVFFISSCASTHFDYSKIDGIFYQKNNENVRLELSESQFLFIDTYATMHLSTWKCCDTISYGTFVLDDSKYFRLSSTDELDNYIDIYVVEKNEKSRDSFYFYFDNPIEMHYRDHHEHYRELLYSLLLSSDNSEFDLENLSVNFDENPIILTIPKNTHLKEFSVQVTPKFEFPTNNLAVRSVMSLSYSVESVNSNSFYINFPQLSYGYFSFRRLNNDFIKIINANVIEWDGNIFFR